MPCRALLASLGAKHSMSSFRPDTMPSTPLHAVLACNWASNCFSSYHFFYFVLQLPSSSILLAYCFHLCYCCSLHWLTVNMLKHPFLSFPTVTCAVVIHTLNICKKRQLPNVSTSCPANVLQGLPIQIARLIVSTLHQLRDFFLFPTFQSNSLF